MRFYENLVNLMKIKIKYLLKRNVAIEKFARKIHVFVFGRTFVSSRYVQLSNDTRNSEGTRLRSAWQSPDLPERQRKLVERQIREYREGVSVAVFDIFVRCLKALPDLQSGMSLLEIGCSSGYYSEVLEVAGIDLEYFGCDYSKSFVEMARKYYPSRVFAVEDATNLRYEDSFFDVVISGCCLLHIPEYQKAVSETVRVARKYVVFHRTPVVWGQDDQWYRKQAYGVETVEIHFNEPQFLILLEENGLEILSVYTLSQEDTGLNQGNAVRGYVCRKKCP